MSASIFSSLQQNTWQAMKRHIAVVELIVTCIVGPFFTTKFLPSTSQGYPNPSTGLVADSNKKIYYSKPVMFWMLGIFSAMCAVNNFLLHLVWIFLFQK